MSFVAHHGMVPMRSLNKEPDWATVYDDLFDQYIDAEDFNFAGSNIARSIPDEHVLENPESLQGSCTAGSSPPNQFKIEETEQDFWARTLQALEDNAASSERQKQPEEPLSIADIPIPSIENPDFLSLGGHPSPHIDSAPATPPRAVRRCKSYGAIGRASKATPKSPGIRKSTRSPTKSARMMTPSRYRSGFREVWNEKPDVVSGAYTLNLPVRTIPVMPVPLSPPLSAKVSQISDSAAFYPPQHINSMAFLHQANMQNTAVPSTLQYIPPAPRMQKPTPSPLTTHGMERTDFPTFIDPFSSRPIYHTTAVPAIPQTTKSEWDQFNFNDDYELSPGYNPWTVAESAQHMNSSALNTAPLSQDNWLETLQPHLGDDLSASGLMISCDPFLTQASYPDYATSLDFPDQPASPYYVITSHQPASPYHATTRIVEQRQWSRSPSPAASPSRSRSRQPRSKSRTRRTQSMPRSPRGVKSSAFVNFTPSDSAKLLKGVAPSGSSKTKAKREKEAAEKRRRFSQAAVRAVVEAGGDLDGLRDVGIVL